MSTYKQMPANGVLLQIADFVNLLFMNQSASEWQKEIYLNGFAGARPQIPADFVTLEQEARRIMSAKAFAYVAGGAGAELTMRNNVVAFAQYSIVPKMLVNVGERDTSRTLFGYRLPAPFLLAPVGVLSLAHREADLAVSRAASTLGLPFIFSNQASFAMEECARVMGDAPRWFQLYWSKSNRLVQSFLRRAEGCGCSAIVVTLDTTMLGWRPRDLNLGYLPFLEGRGIAQYVSDPVFQEMLDEIDAGVPAKRRVTLSSLRGLWHMLRHYPANGFVGKLRSGRAIRAVQKFIATYSNPSTTWNDLEWLRNETRLPIILNGVLHPDDAQNALDVGVDGIIVSNHGGRQVDGAIASLDALQGVVKVIDQRIPVLFDSGIRGGADAFKAIALGATAVCVGRPYVYGLALAGERGVYEVMRHYMAEFELTMGLSGIADISGTNGSAIQRSL